MEKEKELRPIQIYLIYAAPIIALFLVIACISYFDYQTLAKKVDAMDSVSDSTIINAINKSIDEDIKVSTLSQISAIFVDMDEREIKRVAQQQNYQGAQAIGQVYNWAVNHGILVTSEDIRSRGALKPFTYETDYYNLVRMADEINTAKDMIPSMSYNKLEREV